MMRRIALGFSLLFFGLALVAFDRAPAQFGAVKPIINSCGQLGNDAFTKVLLHFNNNLVDTALGAGSVKTWTANDGASVSVAAAKFAPAGGRINSGYIDHADSGDFTLSGDWTLDFWLNRLGSGLGTQIALFGQSPSSGLANASSIGAQFTTGNTIQGYVSDGSVYVGGFSTAAAITDSNYHHFAMVRSGNSVMMFVDGTLSDTIAFTGTIPNSAARFAFGRFGESTGLPDFPGDFDEIRLSVGIARWTSNFTPPLLPYCPN